MRNITLALGGGGIRGIAHIGVLRALEKNGFTIRAIAGTSAGGLIGALYAAGKSPDELLAVITGLDQKKLFTRAKTDGPSLLGIAGLVEVLSGLLGGQTFNDLRLPFACTAVDIVSGQEVILHHGNLLQAVSATAAVPGVFPPLQLDGVTLVDGGVLDNIPVRLARWLTPRLPVAAVALNPPAPHAMADMSMPIPIRAPRPLAEQFARLRLAQALNIYLRSMEISGIATTELRLASEPPDVLVRPALAGIGLLDRVDPLRLVKAGEEAAMQALPALIRSTRWHARIIRYIRRLFKPLPGMDIRHDLE